MSARISADSWEDTMQAALAMGPLRAAGFIVTLYGDVVVPRGGQVWIGNIIAACQAVGISETLVRTAVSRLVAAGQLEARRLGRRSFYHLSAAAETEFATAAEAIYGPQGEGALQFVFLPQAQAEGLMPLLERHGYARLKAQLAVGSDRLPLPQEALVFPAAPQGNLAAFAEFAANAWDLERHAQAYQAFQAAFAPLETLPPPTPAAALAARLLLVHRYRAVVLSDPGLPSSALPKDWPGFAARAQFARLYRRVTPLAESHIEAEFVAQSGPFSGDNSSVRARLSRLSDPQAPLSD